MTGQFFAYDYHGAPFVLFSAPHLTALSFLLLLNFGLARFKGASETVRNLVRISLAVMLWLDESLWHFWNANHGVWSIKDHLPLHACSLLIWLAGFMLVTRNYRIYEFVYVLGIGGAFQYLMTPDLGIYGFPHFRFFQALLSHGLLLTSGVYMTVVEGFRPTWKSLLRVILWANVYMAIIYPINLLIGSNYLFINAKPATASLLDVLPDWPIYIIFMELLGMVTFMILYLPFIIKDWRSKKSMGNTAVA